VGEGGSSGLLRHRCMASRPARPPASSGTMTRVSSASMGRPSFWRGKVVARRLPTQTTILPSPPPPFPRHHLRLPLKRINPRSPSLGSPSPRTSWGTLGEHRETHHGPSSGEEDPRDKLGLSITGPSFCRLFHYHSPFPGPANLPSSTMP
jgi:hypothetical protein